MRCSASCRTCSWSWPPMRSNWISRCCTPQPSRATPPLTRTARARTCSLCSTPYWMRCRRRPATPTRRCRCWWPPWTMTTTWGRWPWAASPTARCGCGRTSRWWREMGRQPRIAWNASSCSTAWSGLRSPRPTPATSWRSRVRRASQSGTPSPARRTRNPCPASISRNPRCA